MSTFRFRHLVFIASSMSVFIGGAVQAKVVSGIAHAEWDSTLPIPKVAVRATYTGQNGATVTLRDTALQTGLFHVNNIPASVTSIRLKVTKVGYASKDTIIALSADSVHITFAMSASMFGEKNLVIKGKFLAPGSANGAANVPFIFYAYGVASPIPFYDTTDADGFFLITGIFDGCISGWIRTQDDAAMSADTTFPFSSDGDTTTLTILAHATLSVQSEMRPGFVAAQGLAHSQVILGSRPGVYKSVTFYSANGRQVISSERKCASMTGKGVLFMPAQAAPDKGENK